jgi:hypothetical protein
VWSISGTIMTGENRITRRLTCPSASMSTTYLTRTDVQSTPGLRGERPAPNRPNQSLCSHLCIRRDLTKPENIPSQDSWWPAKSRTWSLPDSELRLSNNFPGRSDRLVSFRMTVNQYRRLLHSSKSCVSCTTRTG